MSAQEPVETKQFLATFKQFMDQAVAQAPVEEAVFLKRLREHFGTDPTVLPVVSESFEKSEHPNVHIAITHLLERDDWSAKLEGLVAPYSHTAVKIPTLLGSERYGKVTDGPVEYVNISLADDRVLTCVQLGLYLIQHGDRRLALLFQGPLERHYSTDISVQVMAVERTEAENFFSDLRTTMRTLNVYRSHVISFDIERYSSTSVRFHHLPTIEREGIIHPDGVLNRVELQTIGFSRLSERLREAGRHIKRGILLYGPPGTGKTLTAMYLAHQMPNRTVILITGRTQGLISLSCKMARLLQPATVIIEDVDLAGEERTKNDCSVLLFELLNQMDGLADDADILFLLTTNRPDILEPALAARPGRIDQAVEIPLPDYVCRKRLFDLYGKGLTLQIHDMQKLIEQTEGVSGAFIRELMRKSALFAADESHERQDIVIEDRHIDAALKELVLEGGELTKRLLGVSKTF